MKRYVAGKVNVLGRVVKIILTDSDAELQLAGGRQVRAFFDLEAQVIVIDSRESYDSQCYLYAHELAHAVLTYSGAADSMVISQEERVIDRAFVPYLEIAINFPYPVKPRSKKKK